MTEWEEIRGAGVFMIMSYHSGIIDGEEKARKNLGRAVQQAYNEGYQDGMEEISSKSLY